MEWAKNLCNSKTYKDHLVIVLTHTYLKELTNTLTDKESYKIKSQNFGKQTWDKFVRKCPNVRLVICGHTGHPDYKHPGSAQDFKNNTAYLESINDAGKKVFQFIWNIQCLGGGWEGNGGDGWIRILEFLPDGKTIKASTYSVLFGISHMTKQFAHRTDPCCQFDMIIEK